MKLVSKQRQLFEKEELYNALVEEYKLMLPLDRHEELDKLLEMETILNDFYNKQQYIKGFEVGY